MTKSGWQGIFEAVLQKQEVDAEFAKKNVTWIGSDSWGSRVPPRYNKVAHGSLSTIPQVRLSENFDEYFLSLHPSKNNTRNPLFNEYWEEIFNCSFNEAKFINLTMYTLCVLWLAFIPTYFITTALRTSFYTGSLVIAIILSATVTLCCLLVPKVYFLFSRKKKVSDQNPTTSKDTFRSNINPNNVLPDKGQPSYKTDMVDVSIQTDMT